MPATSASSRLAGVGNELAAMLAEQIYKSVSELKRQESMSSKLLRDALALLEKHEIVSHAKDTGADGQKTESGSDFDYIQAQLQAGDGFPPAADSTPEVFRGDASTNGFCLHPSDMPFTTSDSAHQRGDARAVKVVSMKEHLRVVALNHQLQDELFKSHLQSELRKKEADVFRTPPKTHAPRLEELFMPEMAGYHEEVRRRNSISKIAPRGRGKWSIIN